MKTIVLLLATAVTYSCVADKEIQMDLIDVELVKIDTIQRYNDADQQLMTWRDVHNVSYITFEPMTTSYKVGSFMKVMVRK